MDSTTLTAIANEARRNELKASIAGIQGESGILSSLASLIATSANDATQRLTTKQAALSALESGSGAGISADFGYRAAFLEAFIVAAKAAGLITDETEASFRALI